MDQRPKQQQHGDAVLPRFAHAISGAAWVERSSEKSSAGSDVDATLVAQETPLLQLLEQRLEESDDRGVEDVYRHVLEVVDNDRRRRARDRSRSSYDAVLQWVDTHIAGSLPVELIARSTRQSGATLRRLIREHAGLSVASFVRSRRIDAALHLLGQSPKRLALIAGECGFASQSHFSRSIRAKTGLTPSQYRKRLRDRLLATTNGAAPL